MEKEILRVINEMEKMKWITVSPHLNREAIAATFLAILKDMKLKDYLDLFNPPF